MKAISVRQPWAELIIRGEKTLDLRTYQINYTGPLAIHASSIIEERDCQQFGLNPDISAPMTPRVKLREAKY